MIITKSSIGLPSDFTLTDLIWNSYSESLTANDVYLSDNSSNSIVGISIKFFNGTNLYYEYLVQVGTEITNPYPSYGDIPDFKYWTLNGDIFDEFPFIATNSLNFYSKTESYIIPTELTIGSHSFNFNANYLSNKSGRPETDFTVIDVNLLRNIGQLGFNQSIVTNLSYTVDGEFNNIVLTQEFPKFARFSTFSPDKYIAVAEGWGSEDNDGSTWELATTLSHAVELLTDDRDTLLIFDGVYSSIPDLTDIKVKLVNGSDSVDNLILKSKDNYTGSFVVGLIGGKVENNIIYDKLFDDSSIILEDNKTYVRCTFAFKPNLVNSIFKSCVFNYADSSSINGEDFYCIHGINSELGLDSNNIPIYGSILCQSAEDTDFNLVDYLGQPRNRSKVDRGCIEYQYKFTPNEISIIKTIPDGILITSDPSDGPINWFDNSISGYSFNVEFTGDYIGGFYYTQYSGEVNNYHLYEHSYPIRLYLTIYSQESSDIFIDNYNYSTDSISKSRYPYNSLLNPVKYGVAPQTKSIIVTNLRTAVNLSASGSRIIFCRGIYHQLNNSITISKNINIESDPGADQVILVGDNSDSTTRFITINSGNVNITGLTIQNSKSKKTEIESSTDRYGGAIANLGTGTLKVIACRFKNCSSNIGGSVYGGDLYSCIIDGASVNGFSKSYSSQAKTLTLTNTSSTKVNLIDEDVAGFSVNPLTTSLTFNISSGAHQYTYPKGHPLAGETHAHYATFSVTINGVTKSLRSGRNDPGTHGYDGNAINNAGGSIVFTNISTPSYITYSIDYEGHHIGPDTTKMTVSFPNIEWKKNLLASSAITDKDLYNCDLIGNINNSSICHSATNCINLSNQSLSGNTNVTGNYDDNIDQFYRIPFNIVNMMAKISDINLVNNGGENINDYLDFNLKTRGYIK